MTAITSEVFKFSRQVHLDTFAFDLERIAVDLDRYDDVAKHSFRLSLEAICRNADEFAFWQRCCRTGRPPTDERVLLVSFMLRELLSLTFREIDGFLSMFSSYYSLKRVPDHSTLSRKLSSRRWTTVLERFFRHLLESLPERSAVLATDATGYSGRKRGWRETKHAWLAKENWVKVHATVEVDEFIVLSYSLSRSNVHESREFANVWNELPSNVTPMRSLADAAYVGEECLEAARQHGTTPFHSIKSNALLVSKPQTLYQKLVHFARHWPRRFAALYAKRTHTSRLCSR